MFASPSGEFVLALGEALSSCLSSGLIFTEAFLQQVVKYKRAKR